MNSILSLFVCLAMLFSGGMMAEDPNAAAATQITIRDLAVEIQGEHYSLTPSVTLGVSTENDSALLDLFMTLNDQTLFPAQAKVDANGAGVLLGDSNTAYTFTPELLNEMMGGEEIPAEVFSLIDSYTAMLRSLSGYDAATSEELTLAANEKLTALIGDVEVTEATFFANDQEQTGEHFAFELDSDAVKEYMDYSFTLMPEDFTTAYFDFVNTMMALAGGPEVTSFAEVMDLAGMDLSVSGEITGNDDSAVIDLVFHGLVDQSAAYLEMGFTEEDLAELGIEPFAMDMPMTITVHNADNIEYVISYELEGITVDVTAFLIDNGYLSMGMSMYQPDVMNMNFALDALVEENGVVPTSMSMVMEAEGTVITFATETTTGEEITTTGVGLSYFDEAFSGSASFFIDVTHDAITDRISGANVQTIATTEDLEGTAATGLSLAAMGMMSDVEKLMNDESIAAIVELGEQLFGYSEVSAEVVAEPNYEDVSTEPEFAEPVFNWLPEGYTLSASAYEPDYGCYSFVFTKEGIEMYADVYYYYGYEEEDDSYFHFSVDGDEIQRINGDLISVSNYDAYFNVYGNIGSMYVDLTVEDAGVTAEELAKVLSQITIPE